MTDTPSSDSASDTPADPSHPEGELDDHGNPTSGAAERRGRPTTLERAFELARSGDCQSVQEIRERLRAEGHIDSQVTGPSLMRQLRGLIAPKEG